MKYPERPLGDVLISADSSEPTQQDHRYAITGIFSYGKGLIRRPEILGSETSYSSLRRIKSGQIVMSKLNAWEGAIALVNDEFDATYVSPEYPVFDIQLKEGDPSYLKHLISWSALWRKLTPRGSMVRRKRTTPATFLNTKVPLPDLAEQRRVGKRLDEALAKLRDITDLRAAAQHTRLALQESIVAHAANPSPHEIGSIMTLVRRPVAVGVSDEYREIGIRSFGRGIFHKTPVTGASLGTKKIYAVEPGDLLFSSVFAWEGAVARATEADRGRVGSHRFMTYVVDGSKADADYLRFLFLTSTGLDVLRRCSPGGAGRNRTLGIVPFQAEKIPLPTLPDQKRAARVLLGTEEISQRYAFTFNESVGKFHSSLLDAAFTGRL